MRKDAPNIKREPYIKKVVQKPVAPPNGTFWSCAGCGQDKFGKFTNGVLEIKYKERVLTADGVVTVRCRSCGLENKIDLRNYPYSVTIHFSSDEFPIEITEQALQLAQEHGLNIRSIAGTGKDGKITIKDIKNRLT